MPTTDIDRFANDDPHEVGIKYDIPADGLFQVYWPNGNLRYEWEYKDGKRVDGESKSWWSNGTLKCVKIWKNGKLDGLSIHWYESGQKDSEQTWKNGKRNGKLTDWYDDGVKILEHIYKDGKCIERNDRLERKRKW